MTKITGEYAMDPVRWGVLSTARIGLDKVIPGMMKEACGSRVIAIASRDGEQAREAATRLGIAKAYDSYDALLADPEIEAVYNPLPNHLHVPWTLRALEAGKHVLCEKPIALDATEALQLVAAQERSGKMVAEAFMVRHHPQWLRMRALLAEGAIGHASLIRTVFTYRLTDPANIRNQPAIGGGGLLDIGCYAIATARFLFGAEPVRVVAAVDRDPELGIDRLTSGLLDFGAGRQLTFSCATQLAPRQHVEVLGTTGRLSLSVPFNPSPEMTTSIVIDDGRDLIGGGQREERFATCDSYALQADAFSRAIRSETPGTDPILDAIGNMKAIDALWRSERSGRWEQVVS